MIRKNLLNRFIAEAIIYKMSEDELSQKELASSVNISESFLSDSLYGRKRFNVKHLYLIIKKMNISADFIFPNKKTFELIKNSLGFTDFEDFIDATNEGLFNEEEDTNA